MKRDEAASTGNGDDDPGHRPEPFSETAGRRAAPDPREVPVGALEGALPLERAWLELVRVHELEQARLLREACRLRRSVDRGASSRVRSRTNGREPDVERRLALWRRRAEEALELAFVDGLEPHARLRFCVAHAVRRWPEEAELAGASLELEDCRAGRRLARG